MPTDPETAKLYDEYAENAAIGAAFIDPLIFTGTLKPSDFGTPFYPALWAKCQSLMNEGVVPDIVTVPSELLPISYTVQSFIDWCPSAVRIDSYVAIIKDFARRRELIETASAFARAAYAEKGVTYDFSLREAIETLAQFQSGDESEEGWEVFTLEDAYAPRDPLVYVVEGLFAIPSVSIVYGAPGTLKSMLLADMAVCVAVGRDWLPTGDKGGWRKSTTETPTLWLDFDNGKRRTHERMEALAISRGLPEDARFHYVSMPTPWLDGSNENDIVELVQLVESLEAGLVIVDNLRVVSGKGDENSAEMAEVMTGFRRLAEDSGAAVVLVHHQRKGDGKGGGRLGDSLRGHSSIEASIDLALLVTRDGDSDTVDVTSTKTRGVDVPPFGAQFCFTHRPDTQELQTAWFDGAMVETRTSIVHDAILKTVDAEPGINKTSLRDAVREITTYGKQFVSDAIDWLVQNGRLRTEDGTRNAKLYYVVEIERSSFP